MTWRPNGFKNPYPELLPQVFTRCLEAREVELHYLKQRRYYDFEAGASAMLEALRTSPHTMRMDGVKYAMATVTLPGSGVWVFIPDESEVTK